MLFVSNQEMHHFHHYSVCNWGKVSDSPFHSQHPSEEYFTVLFIYLSHDKLNFCTV